MIIQQQQQQPFQVTQVQMRQSLALKQIDQNSHSNIVSGPLGSQPLSPTNTSFISAQRQVTDPKAGARLKELKGPPTLIGLSAIEYQLNDKASLKITDVTQNDIQNNYLQQLYEGGTDESLQVPFQTLTEQFAPNDFFRKVELTITLPFDMTLEHIEFQLTSNIELFQKYLKLLKIERVSKAQAAENTDLLLIRGGAYQDNAKRILEVNTCGVSKQIKIVFLYSHSKRSSQKKEGSYKEKQFSKTQFVSEKIKNEILPLLHGSDEDIDELDDEVAMISNKKGDFREGNSEILSTDDIKIEIKGSTKGTNKIKPQLNQQQQYQTPKNQTKPLFKAPEPTKQEKDSESEETRNFNTLPRNYSEPNKTPQNNESYNNLEITSSQMIDHAFLASQEITLNGGHNETQNLKIPLKDQLEVQEQEVFNGDEDVKNEVLRLLQKCISTIKITGFNCNNIPAITTMTHFINQSFYLKKEKRIEEAMEYDFLSGVLMISTKRYIQAVEVFRRIQGFYLKQLEGQQNPAILLNCAILELLSSESMCQSTQINDKLNSLKRMIELFQGRTVQTLVFPPQIHQSEDPFSVMLKILPWLLKFSIMCLTHKKEIVRLSALKTLEFVLETKGCSLDQSMVFILKALFKTYPTTKEIIQQKDLTTKNQDSFALNEFTQSVQDYFQVQPQQQSIQDQNRVTEYSQLREPQSGFQNALKNSFNHTLETYISVLSSISSHILHQLFYEVIIPCIIVQEPAQQDKAVVQSTEKSNDIKIFAIKIAEKIITICQGDLVLSKQSLEYFLTSTVSNKSPSNDQQTFIQGLRNLWSSIRSKVFTNYSQRGLRTLIDWLVEKMSLIAQNSQNNMMAQQNLPNLPILTESSNNAHNGQDISKLEISDEESQQLLQLFDIVSMISVGRKKNDEEANQLIKIKQEYCLELYLLINPLLFWLDFSVEREERFSHFKTVYQTIKDVLENLPPKRVDIDILQIMIPILQRTSDFMKHNSPSLSMLKFLEIVLRDIKNGNYCAVNPDLQYFFLDMLNNFVSYISYSLYEEVFSVFDKLLNMCQDVMNEQVLTKCITSLVDKYTMKSKSHKNSITVFMKGLMEVKVRSHNAKNSISNNILLDTEGDMNDEDQISVHSKNNYFEILCEFCFFNNSDPSQTIRPPGSNDFRSPTDHHDLYIDKLQFFIDSLQLLTEIHVNLYTAMLIHPKFKSTLLALLNKPETSLRLKCHEIMEIITNYYVQYCTSKTVYELAVPQSLNAKKGQPATEVMEVEYINHERLFVCQLVIDVIKTSLEPSRNGDAYLQFNSLILLDYLFQNLLPVPTYQNEQLRDKVSKQNKEKPITDVIDLESLEINETTPEFEVTSKQYTYMRLNLIFQLWPHVQTALNSAWSNIRSICYGLICSMLKIDVRDFQPPKDGSTTPMSQLNAQYLVKMKQIVLPMLMSLLSSKESESKAGGLNILGSYCGLSYDFSKTKISKNMEFFKKNSSFISLSIWKLVFDLQDDWDITIKEASVVLIQLCAPRDAVKYFDKIKREKENERFTKMLNKYGLGQGVGNTGEQSSRLNSSRGAQGIAYLNSINSNDQEDLIGLPQNQRVNKGRMAGSGPAGDILSFLSNNTDEISMVFQMEQMQQQQQLFSSTDIFDHIGNTLNSNPDQAIQTGVKQPRHQKILSILSQPSIIEEQKRLLDLDNLTHQQLQELIEKDSGAGSGTQTEFQFFVDEYQDEQIQEIISIFRNDFKPPKNLWIEKNQSAAFNGPDYYAEIFSQAIDQFNQQQMQLQQQQAQQMQQQVSGSPKNSATKKGSSGSMNLVDALEDDLVKKYENEKNEKEKLKQQSQLQNSQLPLSPGDQQKQGQNGPDNYMIFERHYEEDKQTSEPQPEKIQPVPITQELPIHPQTIQSTPQVIQPKKEEGGNIDAEPFKFLEKTPPSAEKPEKSKRKSKEKKQLNPQNIDDQDSKKLSKGQGIIEPNGGQEDAQKKKTKKTTDELIEEYERKISKTKQLLEEEKTKAKANIYESADHKPSSTGNEGNCKSTPEFKSKREKQEELQAQQSHLVKSNEKPSNPKKQAQLYISELSKSYLSNIDQAKLIKQINNCFNDNSFNNFNIGPVVMTTNIGANGSSKQKQKLNKSFENIIAHNKYALKNSQEGGSMASAKNQKKNLSTSPRRGSSSGKKSASSKSGGGNKRKYLDANAQQQPKPLYNMRDLNYFIKTIEKDLSDKFNKLNMKDFNSMPTTPTSILKKLEDQMKAINGNGQYNQSVKNQLSNTCPNIAQVLGQLDTHSMVSYQSNQKPNMVNLQNPLNQDTLHRIPGPNIEMSQQHTPSNVSNNITMGGQNSMSNFSIGGGSIGMNNQFDKFSFSKTQKIDLKDTTNQLLNMQAPKREGVTARDHSNENYQLQHLSKRSKASPTKSDSQQKKPLLSAKVINHNKRSRGSQDKYMTNLPVQNYSSGSNSYSKLNKSLNIAMSKKKENLNKSLITNVLKVGQQPNLSPTANKKLIMQQMIKQQLNGQSQASTQLQQTPLATQQNHHVQHQYGYSNNMLFDYVQSAHEQAKKQGAINVKTPVKQPYHTRKDGKTNYSEIIDISPSSGDKDLYRHLRQHMM